MYTCTSSTLPFGDCAQFVIGNSENQEAAFVHIELFLSQMGSVSHLPHFENLSCLLVSAAPGV